MFIANVDAGCFILLILLLPATFLLHTWQTHSGLGKTHPQLCCSAGHLHCDSDPVLLWIILFKALSLSLFPSVTSYTATVFLFKALLVLPRAHPSPLTGHCGVISPQPALELDSIIHYLFHTSPLKKHLCSFSSNAPQGHHINSPQHHGRCLIFHSSLQLQLTMTPKIPFSFLKQHFYWIRQENLC